MTTYFCGKKLLYTYGKVTPEGEPVTYYMYAGQCNINHSLPCFSCSYTTTMRLSPQNCPGDPCVAMKRVDLDKPPDPMFGYLVHDFADEAISLLDVLKADHDTLEPSPSPGTIFSSTRRFFVTFRPENEERDVCAQCRQLLVTELSPLRVFVTGAGFEINSLPAGEVAAVPDSVAKMDPGDPNSGLYSVKVRGDEYHVICTV